MEHAGEMGLLEGSADTLCVQSEPADALCGQKEPAWLVREV